jgi:MYXO-CTERM domain-containing protein
MRRLALLLLLVPTVALADGLEPATVTMAPQPHASTASVLFFNRCRGGCTIKKSGLNDARTHSSQIPDGPMTEFPMTEFAGTEAQWQSFMTCIREVYSPYKVTVTDELPAPGVAYNENIVAGTDRELGVNAGGIAPITSDCSPYSYVLSFTFANLFSPADTETLCLVAAQESGHSFGLDHSFEFIDGSSACRDPMSYRGDCGGQRFFRNESAKCGEFNDRPCRCGLLQNTHVKLLSVLGAGTPITPPPTASVSQPVQGATIANGAVVLVTAAAQRGVRTVEMFLNGYLWKTEYGAAFGGNGQPETTYPLVFPGDVPDGVIDIDIVVKDDIESATRVPTIRVTKGAPCATADTCANGQRCDGEGRCLWDPPAGEFGDACTFEQYCKTGTCSGTVDEQICTQVCQVNGTGVCPANYECLSNGSGIGICWPEALDTGCCSSNPHAAANGLAAFALGAVLLRRRRRR